MSGEKWIMEVPVISTAHITQAAANWLNSVADYKGSGVWGVFAGWLCGPDVLDEKWDVPTTLEDAFEWAHTQGYEWIRLDPDGDVIEDLPIYEWG